MTIDKIVVILCALALIGLIAAKLTGAIGWSWLWVLAPLWAPPVLFVALWVWIMFTADWSK